MELRILDERPALEMGFGALELYRNQSTCIIVLILADLRRIDEDTVAGKFEACYREHLSFVHHSIRTMMTMASSLSPNEHCSAAATPEQRIRMFRRQIGKFTALYRLHVEAKLEVMKRSIA
jgi:hypothetical protein